MAALSAKSSVNSRARYLQEFLIFSRRNHGLCAKFCILPLYHVCLYLCTRRVSVTFVGRMKLAAKRVIPRRPVGEYLALRWTAKDAELPVEEIFSALYRK
jgi:hypothetical protein